MTVLTGSRTQNWVKWNIFFPMCMCVSACHVAFCLALARDVQVCDFALDSAVSERTGQTRWWLDAASVQGAGGRRAGLLGQPEVVRP